MHFSCCLDSQFDLPVTTLPLGQFAPTRDVIARWFQVSEYAGYGDQTGLSSCCPLPADGAHLPPLLVMSSSGALGPIF